MVIKEELEHKEKENGRLFLVTEIAYTNNISSDITKTRNLDINKK